MSDFERDNRGGRSGGKSAGGEKGGGRRTFFRRRRVCKFCAEKIDYISYKDVKLLAPFIPERGKIQPRRISGVLRDAPARAADGHQARSTDRARAVRHRLSEATDMSIEVILKEHVEHLGHRGEVVKVAAGYARNYLFPRKLALAVTAENKRQIERERAKAEAREADELQDAQAQAAKLAAVEVSIARRVGEQDALYGSVTAADIAEALAALGQTVDRRKIQMAEPLKTLGEHEVPVKLHREVTVPLKVKVVAAS